MKRLTKAEEEIMRIIWKLKECMVREILEEIPEPKPAQTTISTVVRILEQKNFVDHKAYGRTHVYFPIIAQEDYSKSQLDTLMGDFFEGSPMELVSFLVKRSDLNLKDLNDIIHRLSKSDQS